MIQTGEGYDRLEYFSNVVAADRNRKEFDIRNHSILYMKKKPDFLFIGDSITEYWELGAYFNRPDCLIINRGIGGDTTEYLKRRFYVDAVQLAPAHCILGIGINDSIDLEGDYWKKIEPRNYEEVLLAAQENIDAIITQAREAGMKLILTSLLPINIPILQHESVRKRYIKELNQWLSKKAKAEKLIFVNYYQAMVFPGTNRVMDGITYDGLHPNAKGYEIMAAVLRNNLQQNQIEI